MRRSIIVLLAALMASGGSTFWMWQQLRAERDANSVLRERLTVLGQQSTTAVAPLQAAARASSSATSERVTKVDAHTPPANLPASPQDDIDNRQLLLLKNPEYLKALRAQRRQTLEYQFRQLAQVLKLTPEKSAALFDLLADQSVEAAVMRWQSRATEGEERALRSAMEERDRKADADLETLLGASNMIRLREFRETLGSRIEVNRLRSELSGGAEPLRDDQFEPMLGIVFAEQQRMNRELQDYYTTGPTADGTHSIQTEFAVAANQRIVESAKAILTKAQLTAIEELYRRQRAQMEAQDTITRIQFEEMKRSKREAGGS
jgi:hypothetical protein